MTELSKNCNRYRPFCGETLPVQFDAFDLVQCFGGEVTFPAVRATDDGDILNNKQIPTFAITACHVTNANPFLSTNIANHQRVKSSRTVAYGFSPAFVSGCGQTYGSHGQLVQSDCTKLV